MIEAIRKKQFPSLSRYFFIIVQVVVVTMIAASVWLTWRVYSLQSERTMLKLEYAGERIDRKLTDSFDYIAHLMEFMDKRISRKQADDYAYVAELLTTFSANPKVQTILSWSLFSWTNEAGEIVVSANHGVLDKKVSATGRSYLPMTRQHPGKLWLSAPGKGLISREWIIPGGWGVADNKEKYMGTIVLGFDIASLVADIEEKLEGEGISFAILDQNMNIVSQAPGHYLSKYNIMPRLETAITEADKGQVTKETLLGGDEVNTIYFRSEHYPFIFVLSADPKLTSIELQEKLFPRILEFGAVALFLLIVVYLLRNRVIRPIQKLSNVADHLAKGETDVEIPHGNIEEIENLSSHIAHIHQYIEEHQKIEKELVRQKQMLETARDEAEQLARTQSEFLASMSHELRTPLNAIIAFAESISEQLYGEIKNEKYLEYARDIHHSGKHLLEIINDLLDLSKAEAGMMELHEENIELNRLIQSCIRLLADRAQKSGIKVVTELESDIPKLFADELRLKQILLNLLSNAIKFTPENGTVTVRSGCQYISGQLTGMFIVVEDTGVGMSKEDIPKALSKFGQLEGGLEFAQEGTGLGLPLTRQLVELHGGELDIESSPGIGTKITVFFHYDRIRG